MFGGREKQACLRLVKSINQSITTKPNAVPLLLGLLKITSDIKLLNKKHCKNRNLFDILFLTFDTCSLQPTFIQLPYFYSNIYIY